MKVGVMLNNETEGRIIFSDMFSVKCKIERGKYYLERNCKGCGANEVKDYKCAYCGKLIDERITDTFWKNRF